MGKRTKEILKAKTKKRNQRFSTGFRKIREDAKWDGFYDVFQWYEISVIRFLHRYPFTCLQP
jgi:hypothetical protein